MNESPAPKAPAGLSAPGRRLWRGIAGAYDLRPDEQLVLEKACRTADDSARLDAALRDAPLMVTGSTGQQRHNPLLHEARQTRALLAALLKQLDLPDEPAAATDSAGLSPGSVKAITAARARWGGPSWRVDERPPWPCRPVSGRSRRQSWPASGS